MINRTSSKVNHQTVIHCTKKCIGKKSNSILFCSAFYTATPRCKKAKFLSNPNKDNHGKSVEVEKYKE
jgi:hypothetical protein